MPRSTCVGLVSLLVTGCTVTKLDLAHGPIRMTIVQRQSKPVPGSKGTIEVEIGDITSGQVLLSIRGVSNTDIVDTVSVEPGDVVPIPIGKNEYYLKVIELRNLIVGHDFGVFEISETPPEGHGGSRKEWWFPTKVPQSGMLRYSVGNKRKSFHVDRLANQQISVGNCDVAMSVVPLDDRQGLRIRPADTNEFCQTDTMLGIWIWYLQAMHNTYESDSQISPTEFVFGGGPILRGPWRAGDRILFAWSVLFASGIVHAEVRSVDDLTICLVFDFWGGPAWPAWRGSGEVTMTNDVDGLHEAQAQWSWTYRSTRVEESVTVKRLSPETD